MMVSIQPGQGDNDRMDRSRRIGWIDLEKISDASCLVVGAGALGNEVVKCLVLSGFRHITIVDMDRVVRSNLNRCIFFREEDHVRSSLKAQVVASRAMELVPGIEVKAFVGKVEELSETAWSEHSVVFGCLDNISARLHVNAHAYHARVPYIDGGTAGMAGKVQVVLPPSTPCLQCSLNRTHFKVMEKRYSCTGADVSFFEPKMAAEITTTSVIAAIQVREAIKIISGHDERCIRNVLHYNGVSGISQELEISIDPQCPMHSNQNRFR